MKCCNKIKNTKNIIDPFSTIYLSRYYDGESSGIKQCLICKSKFLFFALGQDDTGTIRVFCLSKITEKQFMDFMSIVNTESLDKDLKRERIIKFKLKCTPVLITAWNLHGEGKGILFSVKCPPDGWVPQFSIIEMPGPPIYDKTDWLNFLEIEKV